MFKFLKEKLQSWTKKFSEEEKPKERAKGKSSKAKPQKKKRAKTQQQKSVKEREYRQPELKELKEIEEEEIEERITAEEDHERLGYLSLFDRIKSKLTKIRISEEDFEPYAEELNMLLLENNVAFDVAEKIISKLKEKISNKELSRKEVGQEIKLALKETIEEILIEPFDVLDKIKRKNKNFPKEPFVILFAGINGSGKTTTIAKIANFLEKKDISCVLAAGDTFRAASIEQIKKHGEKLGIKVISQQYGADPASVGFDAISYAKKNGIKCVLIDTAGRMHTAKNLLKEIEKISKVCKPDLKLFIGESITGNDAVEQAKGFDESIGI
ncbi:MAG: signal recognition particle receptor subunit alpha, partial [Nanoarchaeota archaeon]